MANFRTVSHLKIREFFFFFFFFFVKNRMEKFLVPAETCHNTRKEVIPHT